MEASELFRGLFSRLHGSGLHPVLAGELAAANYPNGEHMPMRAPRVRADAVHMHTENYLDRGTQSLEETWLNIWGVTPLQYMDIAPHSPAARELGLVSDGTPSPALDASAPAKPRESFDHRRFSSAIWLGPYVRTPVIAACCGDAMPETAAPAARYVADIVAGISLGASGMLDGERKKPKRNVPEAWWTELGAVALGYCVFQFTEKTNWSVLVTGEAATYLRATLKSFHPGAEAFISVPSEEPGHDSVAMAARASRLITESAERNKIRLRNDWVALAPTVIMSYVAGERLIDDQLKKGFGVGLAEALQTAIPELA